MADPMTDTARPEASTVLLLPALLGHYGYRDMGSLACVCKGFYEHLLHREDSWAVICSNMGRELQLYSPPTYSHGWKHFFWEHLMVSELFQCGFFADHGVITQ